MSLKAAISSDRGLWLILIVLLGIVYGLMYNPYWAPGGGDDAAYMALARNLLNGDGYTFNGEPEGIIPPGWPLVLAAAMWISPTFALLNLLSIVFLLGMAATWYRIARRFAEPPAAFVIALLSTTLLAVHWSASHVHTEALFSLLLAVSLLLAFQISEGHGSAWRVVVLGIAGGVLVSVRLAGLLAAPMLLGVVLSGQWRPARNRAWLAAGLLAATMAGMFAFLRYAPWQDLFPVQPKIGRATVSGPAGAQDGYAGHGTVQAGHESLGADGQSVGAGHETMGNGGQSAGAPPAAGPVNKSLHQPPMLRLSARSVGSLLGSGEWFAKLFWPLGNVGQTAGAARAVATAVGTILIVPLLAILIAGTRRGQWLWCGMMLYCLYFILTWGVANERYLAPIAVLLVLGMYRGTQILAADLGLDLRRGLGRAVILLFLAGVFGYNLSTLAVNIWAARGSDFYGRYHAGAYKDLLAAGAWLNEHGVADDEIAVNTAASNVGAEWQSHPFGLRAMYLLTGRRIRLIPAEVCSTQPTDESIRWLQDRKIRYYLCRLPTSPWRIWHFRIPWIQERVTGRPAVANPDWVLFHINKDRAESVDVSACYAPLRTVPGVLGGGDERAASLARLSRAQQAAVQR
jgi:hypothetical protein